MHLYIPTYLLIFTTYHHMYIVYPIQNAIKLSRLHKSLLQLLIMNNRLYVSSNFVNYTKFSSLKLKVTVKSRRWKFTRSIIVPKWTSLFLTDRVKINESTPPTYSLYRRDIACRKHDYEVTIMIHFFREKHSGLVQGKHLFSEVISNYLINKVKSPRYWVVLLRTLLQSHFRDRSQSQSIVEGKSFYSHGSRWDNANLPESRNVPTLIPLPNNNWPKSKHLKAQSRTAAKKAMKLC